MYGKVFSPTSGAELNYADFFLGFIYVFAPIEHKCDFFRISLGGGEPRGGQGARCRPGPHAPRGKDSEGGWGFGLLAFKVPLVK